MKSYAASEGGYAYSQLIINDNNLNTLMLYHANNSRSPLSPFISLTKDPAVANYFAGQNGRASLIITDRAFPNPYNNFFIPAGRGGTLISESEFLIPNYIRLNEMMLR